jgi:hypothetical protein
VPHFENAEIQGVFPAFPKLALRKNLSLSLLEMEFSVRLRVPFTVFAKKSMEKYRLGTCNCNKPMLYYMG